MGFVSTLSDMITGLVSTQTPAVPALTPLDISWAERSDALLTGLDARYQLYAWYYDGAQRDPTILDFGAPGVPTVRPEWGAAHNLCGIVVDVLVERLNVTGVSVAGTGVGENEDAAQQYGTVLWDWWQRNRMDATQMALHTQTAVKGDSYLLVGWDAARDMPTLTFNDARDITPIYDPDHTLIGAYKTWTERWVDERGTERTRGRITKYLPDRIEKYASENGSAWYLYTDDVDADGNPDGGVIDWTDRNGQPLGVPVIHFRNRPNGDDFGRSELADIVPAQDAYNDRHWSTDEAMRYQGSPQRYIVGADRPKDGWNTGPGQVWTIAQTGTQPVQAGQFQAGNVAELQEATDRQLKTIAAISRTPMHLLWPEGGLPSGESLKTAESGLVAKARNRAVVLGNAYEDMWALAVRLHNTFSTGPAMAEDVTINCQWGSFETRSALADEQALALKADDLSWAQRMRERGYSEDEITRIRDEKDADTPPALKLADQFARGTDVGDSGDGAA